MCNEGVSQCAIKTALHNNCWSDEKNSLRNRLKNKVYLTWCEINYRVAPKDYFNSTFVETTNRSFLLSRNKHGTKKLIGSRPPENAKKMNVTKDWYINNLPKPQVYVAHSFWVICWNISSTIVEICIGLCMETPYLCTVLVHKSSFFSLEN